MRELISLLFWVLLAAVAFGQGFNPYTPQSDPRAMRARREQAVTHVGSDQIARKIVEEFGEDAVAALLACSPETAKRLAQWHNNGDLNRQVVKAHEDRPTLTTHMFRKRAFTMAWQAGVDPRRASIAYGCNVDTLMRHYVSLDEQQVTNDVFAQMNGRK